MIRARLVEDGMAKTIVVGTDGSETASMVVRRTARLASALDAVVHIVSAYKSIAGTGKAPYAPAFASERADAEAILMEALEVVRGQQVQARTHAIPGDPAEALLQVAEAERAGMIVVGNKGLTGARRFLLGSVPDKVSHHASCNVMIIRSDIDRAQPTVRSPGE
jgi:nucleotide-binding universal stress UspA family protein